MSDLTNKNIEFLSNRELVEILQSILKEIDLIASSGAYRSTTYLAVSAIEGLFGEILKLKRIMPGAKGWPVDKKTGNPTALNKLTLMQREIILENAKALPANFETLYEPIRRFRDYMHPDRELQELKPIDQSTALLALACLNALIEMYMPLRFVAMQEWRLLDGLAQVPAENTIQMPQQPGNTVSLLISEMPAKQFREIGFQVIISSNAIFNFVYNFCSLDQFMAARIEGRADYKGRGQIQCTKWRNWFERDQYTPDSAPDPKQQKHTVHVVLDPSHGFIMTVDGISLALQRADWDFDPDGRIGFMTEWGGVSIVDLELQTR